MWRKEEESPVLAWPLVPSGIAGSYRYYGSLFVHAPTATVRDWSRKPPAGACTPPAVDRRECVAR